MMSVDTTIINAIITTLSLQCYCIIITIKTIPVLSPRQCYVTDCVIPAVNNFLTPAQGIICPRQNYCGTGQYNGLKANRGHHRGNGLHSCTIYIYIYMALRPTVGIIGATVSTAAQYIYIYIYGLKANRGHHRGNGLHSCTIYIYIYMALRPTGGIIGATVSTAAQYIYIYGLKANRGHHRGNGLHSCTIYIYIYRIYIYMALRPTGGIIGATVSTAAQYIYIYIYRIYIYMALRPTGGIIGATVSTAAQYIYRIYIYIPVCRNRQ